MNPNDLRNIEKVEYTGTKEFKQLNTAYLSKKILEDIDEVSRKDIQGKECDVNSPDYIAVQLKYFTLDPKEDCVFKDLNDHNFWIYQSQVQKYDEHDWDTAIDYITNGLRSNPLNLKLLFNYACFSEKMGRIQIARKFFKYCQNIKPRWTDALFGEAITYFKECNFKQSKRCVKIAIRNYKNDSLQDLNEMIYFKAMCYKNLGKFEKAQRDYVALGTVFKHTESKLVLDLLSSLVGVLFSENRYL